MNSKHTFTWFFLAVVLFGFIAGYHFFEKSKPVEPVELLPDLHPLAVIGVQVSPRNAAEISAVNTNGAWSLTQPVAYPAQASAIDSFLTALQKLKPAMRLSPAEASQNHSQLGFESPWASLVVQSAAGRYEILVGNKTAPGDQVYVQVVGRDGVFVTDADWLKFIPQSANEWRDTALAGDTSAGNFILLTNGTRIIELQRNATNHLWQMIRPMLARANGDYIASALQKLQTAQVSRFITDNPNADLSAFGLQPANLDLWIENGPTVLTAIHVGKASTNDSTEVFARRDQWNSVVTTAAQPLSPWMGSVNDFRDPYLFELTAPVAEIEMIGPGTNHFVLQRQGANTWTIPGENFPVDAGSVQSFIQTLASLRVSEFVKDVATPADLPAYGLKTPSRQINLRAAAGNTNGLIAQLLFGAVRTNEVFVQRSDENSVYAISPEDFGNLPMGPGWQFRDRRIWKFSESDVSKITVRQNGKTMELLHNGPSKWSLAAGSQGIITPTGIEYAAQNLSDLEVGSAQEWLARNVTDPALAGNWSLLFGPGHSLTGTPASFGFKPGSLSVAATLKDGQTFTVDIGAQLGGGNTALATVILDGEQWVFILPPDLYYLIKTYLAISQHVP
ncbi:MAG TPA: DUF4340 domain-containing protein [Verrucomicrobiae bacterium]|jgi:hypothetical protein|nr:DUF4340 domain-containing protein [Verrucomicrobiae bacterium]